MISPLEFFGHLRWIDDRPLMDVLEPYRQRIFTETLYTLGEDRTPHYNLARLRLRPPRCISVAFRSGLG